MCGIYGYYRLGLGAKVDKGFVELGDKLLAHRGPDAKGFEEHHRRVGIGHRRLSIIDPRNVANQPMRTAESVLTFNGEVYNYKELYRLFPKSVKFRTKADTEVLQRGLDRWGMKFVNKCNGMFAFCYYNKRKRELLLVRDRYGVKPLYFMVQDEVVYFASEMKPLARIKKNRTRNLNYYQSYFEDTATDYNERTCLEGIFQVKNGVFLKCGGESYRMGQWYRGKDYVVGEIEESTYKDTLELVEELLVDAIKIRLRSDVPLCITLSGGLDSTTIYTLMKERLGVNVKPFTFVHQGSPTSEHKFAQKLASIYGDRVELVKIGDYYNKARLEKALWHLEFPSWGASIMAYMETYKAIADRGFKVVIEGHGADEQLGGYPYMVEAAYGQALGSFRLLDAWHVYELVRTTRNVNLGQNRGGMSFAGWLPIAIKLAFLYNTGRMPKVSLNETLRLAFDYKILPIVLRTFDRASMAYSLESRSPFMDYRLVELFRALPDKYKLGRLGSKVVLREVLRKYDKFFLVENRTKMGFSIDEPKFYNARANKRLLKRAVGQFNIDSYEDYKERAVNNLGKKKIGWPDVEAIWKVAAVEMSEEILDI